MYFSSCGQKYDDEDFCFDKNWIMPQLLHHQLPYKFNSKYEAFIIINNLFGMNKQLIIPLLAVAVAAGALFYLSPAVDEKGNLTKDGLQCEYRFSICVRAQRWVDLHIPYNQQQTFEGWRMDCSGYVSMAWNLEFARPGLTTWTMHTVAHNIDKDELQPGDAINCDSWHIVIFGGWADNERTHYWSYEEGPGTVKQVTPYPYWSNQGCFHPIRFNDVCPP